MSLSQRWLNDMGVQVGVPQTRQVKGATTLPNRDVEQCAKRTDGFAYGHAVSHAAALAVGAELIVSDVEPARARRTETAFGARIASPEEICAVPADVLAPCALGGVLDERTIAALAAPVIAGAPNNQLLDPEDGERLRRRGITYARDYVINAGGMLNAAFDILGGYDRRETLRRIDAIFERTFGILERARAEGRATNAVADDLARARVEGARRARASAARD